MGIDTLAPGQKEAAFGEQSSDTEKAASGDQQEEERSYAIRKAEVIAQAATLGSERLSQRLQNALTNLEKAQMSQRGPAEEAVVNLVLQTAKTEKLSLSPEFEKDLRELVQVFENEMKSKTPMGRKSLEESRSQRAALEQQDQDRSQRGIEEIRKRLQAA